MAKDLYHETVKTALQNDGWTITHDPYPLKAKPHQLKIDLGAKRMLAAEKQSELQAVEKIAVEVKTFAKDSFIYEFYEVLGQYLTYETFLAEQEMERILYLAVSASVYRFRFLRDESVLKMCAKMNVKFIIFNPKSKKIESWNV
jgi:XisH protein